MLNDLDKATICAANNADWYQCMFAARKLPQERHSSLWWSSARSPAYHSNLVTLDGSVENQRLAIVALDLQLKSQWSLKDSFARLDLEPDGFSLLFSADWIWRDPQSGVRPTDWTIISSPAGLIEWELAWRDGGSPTSLTQFPPDMLNDPTLTFFSKLQAGKITAGFITNRSANAIGISNFFANGTGAENAYLEATLIAASAAPHLPIVGYERSGSLPWALEAGFHSVGQLRIWLSPGTKPPNRKKSTGAEN